MLRLRCLKKALKFGIIKTLRPPPPHTHVFRGSTIKDLLERSRSETEIVNENSEQKTERDAENNLAEQTARVILTPHQEKTELSEENDTSTVEHTNVALNNKELRKHSLKEQTKHRSGRRVDKNNNPKPL